MRIENNITHTLCIILQTKLQQGQDFPTITQTSTRKACILYANLYNRFFLQTLHIFKQLLKQFFTALRLILRLPEMYIKPILQNFVCIFREFYIQSRRICDLLQVFRHYNLFLEQIPKQSEDNLVIFLTRKYKIILVKRRDIYRDEILTKGTLGEIASITSVTLGSPR